ncbi:MAG: ester cyclase [Frankiaceae bacterium]
MTRLADHLLRLWMNPLPDGDAALAAFREVYADPVRVNGIDMPVEELVQRARALHVAFDQLGVKVDQQVEASGVLVIGFRMRGRHVGPLATPLGEIPATGRDVEVRTIDILTARDDVVTDVFVVADELGRLSQLGAVTLVPASSE